MALIRIHHIGVAVRQVDAALPFYRDLMGLPVTNDAVLEDQGVRGVLLSAGETEIELLEPQRPDSAVGRFLTQRGEGLHHLCFETDDVEQELSVARPRALPLVDEQPRPGLAGMIAFLHPRATRGVLVEYAQPLRTDERPVAPESPGHAQGRFDHLAVAVQDLDAGVSAYQSNFDLRETERRAIPALEIQAATLPISQGWIGVVTPLSAESAVARFLRARGEGLYLISFAVPALEPALNALAAAGVSVTPPHSAAAGLRVGFVSPRSTCGVLIQLVERRAPV